MSKKRYREEIRDTIVNATLELLQQRQFEEIKIDDIMKKAGFTKGTFYQYFDRKEGLWRYMVEVASIHFRMMLTTAQEKAFTPKDALDMLLSLQRQELNEFGILMKIFARAVLEDEILRKRLLDRILAFIIMFGGKPDLAKAYMMLGTFIVIWTESKVPENINEDLYRYLFSA